MAIQKVLLFIALAVLFCSLSVFAIEKDGEVVVLTDATFEAEIVNHDLALVEFYAPWCGHCKQLEPKYAEAATAMAADPELNNVAVLVKFDADANKKIAGKMGVSGFPTLKLFRNGEFAEDFEGDRSKEGILAFMKKKAEVAVNKEITTLSVLKTLTNVKTAQRTTIVGFFASKTSVDYKYFSTVVTQFASAGIDAYHTASPAVLEGFGFYGGGSSIQMYRPGAKPFKVVYRGTIFKQQLKDWILANAVPQVGEYTSENEKMYTLVGDNIIRFLQTKGHSVEKKFLQELSKEHPTLKFAVSSAEMYKNEFEAHCDKGIKICVLAQEGKKSKKNRVFGISGDFSEENVKTFIADFNAKKLKVKVKSEAAPAKPAQAGEVAVVVGTTFNEIVGDSSKDVLIEFYAPWCGHCKNLAPKYDELAKSLSDEFDSVLIAKFDADNNDIPDEFKHVFSVSGFPTIYFAPKGKKTSPLKYEGAREAADMKKWVLEKRTN